MPSWMPFVSPWGYNFNRFISKSKAFFNCTKRDNLMNRFYSNFEAESREMIEEEVEICERTMRKRFKAKLESWNDEIIIFLKFIFIVFSVSFILSLFVLDCVHQDNIYNKMKSTIFSVLSFCCFGRFSVYFFFFFFSLSD